MYVCMYVCMCVYVCMYECMYVYVCQCECLYVFMYVCMCVCSPSIKAQTTNSESQRGDFEWKTSIQSELRVSKFEFHFITLIASSEK